MQKLILDIQISLDGYIAARNGTTDWMVWNWGAEWTWDKELQDFHTALTTSCETILISRQMAEEGFNAHWENVLSNTNDSRYVFAKHVTECRKIVFSHVLTEAMPIPGGWKKTSIARGELVEMITDLKRQSKKDIHVYGGAKLVNSLLDVNLIDEIYLLINPVALGEGIPLFKSRIDFKLVDCRAYPSGMVMTHYRRS